MTFWDCERDLSPETLPAHYHLTWNVFQIAFSKVVPVCGEGNVFVDPSSSSVNWEMFTKFVKKEIFGRGASLPKAGTWMKHKGPASADRLYAVTVFFALWQGPTQLEPFWPAVHLLEL